MELQLGGCDRNEKTIKIFILLAVHLIFSV